MGCFHILVANLKIPYKKCDLLSLRGWWVKSEIIADEPVDKTLEQWHYSRGTWLHKQTYEALVRFKCKSLEEGFQLIFTSKKKKVREETTHANLLALCNDEDFQ